MKRFKNILCVIEAAGSAEGITRHAVALAEANQASLSLVAMADRLPRATGLAEGEKIRAQLVREISASREQWLRKLVASHGGKRPPAAAVLEGPPFLAIIRKVIADKHDLVIKTAENPAWTDRLFGSDDLHLLRKCPCPLWLMKPDLDMAHRRILCAVSLDPSDTLSGSERAAQQALNQDIFELASSMALAQHAELHVAHAWEALAEPLMRNGFSSLSADRIASYVEQVGREHAELLDAYLRTMVDRLGGDVLRFLRPESHLLKGPAVQVIPELAKDLDVDLVVMGTVARSGIPGLLMGNTAETILDQLNCSVLGIKPPGFVSPVRLS